MDLVNTYDGKPTFWKDNTWVIYGSASGYWFIHWADHPNVSGVRYYTLNKHGVKSPEKSEPSDWSVDYGSDDERSLPPPPRISKG